MHTTDYLKISTDRNAANTIILNNVVPYDKWIWKKKEITNDHCFIPGTIALLEIK